MTPVQCLFAILWVALVGYTLGQLRWSPKTVRVLARPYRNFDQWVCETCGRAWVLTFDKAGGLETPHTMREMVNHKCKVK